MGGKPMYVMYMIGANRSGPKVQHHECMKEAKGEDVHHLEGYISLAWSESVVGPWTELPYRVITSGNPNRWDTMVTNPAPLFPFQNTTTYLFYRGTQWPTNSVERIGLTKATHFKGPFGRVLEESIFTGREDEPHTFAEDPFIWKDHKGR